MPAPGEQHLSSGGRTITNPFEEVKPRISEFTAQEIVTLQGRLEKQLGPEYISSRSGPSGQKVHYLAAEKCIQLANEVFGFNGWSSQIMDVQVDFVDEHPQTLKISLGLSVIVRVTLRDGTFHEDIGYGHMENCKGKAAAFEKAKKEGTTDALKRALRNFGNVLGNCIYDKEYLSKVTKVKAQPTKWDVDNLHRHPTFAPVKKEPNPPNPADEESQYGNNAASITSAATLDDEFGDFDEADFGVGDPDAHPDEVVLPGPSAASNRPTAARSGNSGASSGLQAHSRPTTSRPQAMAAPPGRPQNGTVTNSGGNAAPQPQPQPQTPHSGFTRSASNGSGQGIRAAQDPVNQSRPALQGQSHPIAGRILMQPSRNGAVSAPGSPGRVHKPSDGSDAASLPPQGAGFYSARAATMLPEGQGQEGVPAPIPNNMPVFNPHAESPSIRKTPGVDHKSSKPLTKDLKHVPGSTQAAPGPAPGPRGNIVTPQLDTTRRIGAPNNPSPMSNRSMYKPPLKRPVDSGGGGFNSARTPLVDLPANEPIAGSTTGGDLKRQRLNG
ncbi:Uncharacterized protein BP5553_05266 [Venustampulla echinocandica]|uniref:RAD52 homolog n=1 Tax=Venustampulla echinocandica TaxID=2656787 RepID=A0A370TQN5_9HELO|nr:Uncharacterized protein BP5553_05266 [Venustampulla echinocandica]RDL37833.1 Uncharacterized protein BP5553_05266 [Venustampulla echinocandica]